ILRVIAGNSMNKIDIFRGRQPLNLEIGKPPEMQPLGHQGMDPAEELFLLVCIPNQTISEMQCAAHSRSVTGAADGDCNASHRSREANLVEHGPQFLLREFRI